MFKYYLTSITQKAHRTYQCILEGADVGVLWSYVVEETGAPRGNHAFGEVTTALPHADARDRTQAAAVTSEGFTLALSRPCNHLLPCLLEL